MRQTKRNGLIGIVTVATILGVVVGVAVSIVNRRLETALADEIARAVESDRFAGTLDYREIDVRTLRGEVVLSGLRFRSVRGPLELSMERAVVSGSPFEIVRAALAGSPAPISSVSLSGRSIGAATEEWIGEGAVGSITVDLTTTFAGAEPMSTRADLLSSIEYAEAAVRDASISPSRELLEQIRRVSAEAPWISDESLWRVESLELSVTPSSDRVRIEAMSVRSPAADVSGHGEFGIGPGGNPAPRSLTAEVTDLHPGVREQVTRFAQFYRVPIPESGPFRFTFQRRDNEPASFDIQPIE